MPRKIKVAAKKTPQPKMRSKPANDNLITRAKFAELAHISIRRVDQLVKAGQINIREKLIDLEGRRTREKLAFYQRKLNPSGDNPEGPNLVDGLKTLEGLTIDKILRINKEDIDKIKRMLDAQKTEQDIRRTRGQLVDRDFITRIFHRFFTILDQELKPLGDRITPEVLAICKLDVSKNTIEARDVNEMATKYIYKMLGHVKHLFNDALDKINAEPIK